MVTPSFFIHPLSPNLDKQNFSLAFFRSIKLSSILPDRQLIDGQVDQYQAHRPALFQKNETTETIDMQEEQKKRLLSSFTLLSSTGMGPVSSAHRRPNWAFPQLRPHPIYIPHKLESLLDQS